MLSSIFLIVLFILSTLLAAGVLALVARWLKSPRARFVPAVVASLLISAVNILGSAAYLLLPKEHSPVWAAGIIFIFVGSIAAIFLILKRTFQVSWWRTGGMLIANFAAVAIIFLLTAYVVKPLVLEAFVIPTNSMQPTLEQGDHFLVNKTISPRRWNIVAYWSNEGQQKPQIYCKRLVGLPGEHLKFQNGQLYVNDQLVMAPPVVAGQYHASPESVRNPRYAEGETINLADDEIFVIGDHANQSRDSRFDGPSKASDIVGVVDLIYWPFGKIKILR